MSVVDGQFLCDRCGGGCGNGSVMECAIISMLDHTTGTILNLHLCMKGERAPDGQLESIEGCAVEVLDQKALKYFYNKVAPKRPSPARAHSGDSGGAAGRTSKRSRTKAASRKGTD